MTPTSEHSTAILLVLLVWAVVAFSVYFFGAPIIGTLPAWERYLVLIFTVTIFVVVRWRRWI